MEIYDVAAIIIDIIKVFVVPIVIAYVVLTATRWLDPFTRLLLYVLVLPTAVSFYALAFLSD